MRCVFDTNVIISALLIRNSAPANALTFVEDSGIVLYSAPVLEEIAEVLSRPKFTRYIDEDDIVGFLARIDRSWQKIAVTHAVSDCRDAKDNKFLELALSGSADYLVSGDQDLLTLHPYRGILVLKPDDFLANRV